ncbi:MAG: hypothetical protein P1V36_17300, partial [Planctomycetota bacterium]|nr:hypothetical protein [Planctomycetota bacterium]
MAVGSTPASAEDVPALYEVDFSGPLHVLDSAPTTGSATAPRATPTMIRSNPVVVVPSYGDLLDQPASFPGTRRGDMAFSLAGMP